MRHFKTTLAVLGAATILVLAANTVALATTGKAILAGKINTSSKMTSLVRTTPGTGLQVKTKSAANAPFAVNGKGKVANLNVDAVDGLDSSKLVTKPYVFTRLIDSPVSSFSMIATVPAGAYLASYSAYLKASPTTDLGYVDCFVTQTEGAVSHFVAENFFDTGGASSASASGTGFVTKSSTGTIRLTCSGAAIPFINGFGVSEPIQFVLTPVNGYSTATARIAPGSARTSH